MSLDNISVFNLTDFFNGIPEPAGDPFKDFSEILVAGHEQIRAWEARVAAGTAPAPTSAMPTLPRRCFVTTGSIASFRPLLEEVLSASFLLVLRRQGYTVLEIQAGPDHQWLSEKIAGLKAVPGLEIRALGFVQDFNVRMLECRGLAGVRRAGVVIAHAGSGTVMEALRYKLALIVVPNPTLLDNHQAELAEECERKEWAVVGKLGSLDEALHQSNTQSMKRMLDSLPEYTEPPVVVPETERNPILDRILLTYSYPDEFRRQARDTKEPSALSLVGKSREATEFGKIDIQAG